MSKSKVCFKCLIEKPVEEFYRHKNMSDGFLNKCKECTKQDVLTNRGKNIERVREYDRQRAKLPHRRAAQAVINKAWREEDTRRQNAHNAVRRAIMNGSLIRQPCERCGNENSVAHHEDYDKQLEVMWLCQPCHKKRHQELLEIL